MLEKIKEITEITRGLQLERLYFLMWWYFTDKKFFVVAFLKKADNK